MNTEEKNKNPAETEETDNIHKNNSSSTTTSNIVPESFDEDFMKSIGDMELDSNFNEDKKNIFNSQNLSTIAVQQKIEKAQQTILNKLNSLNFDRIEQQSEKILEQKKFAESQQLIINGLHKELQDYKNHKDEALITQLALEIIHLLDVYQKTLRDMIQEKVQNTHIKKNISKQDIVNSFTMMERTQYKILLATIQDIGDCLQRQGIEKVKSMSRQGDVPNTKTQHIVRLIPTKEESLINKICCVVGAGYEYDNRLIRKEQIYVYKKRT
jgi:molecular chaperone GrpE (heat shock protein)